MGKRLGSKVAAVFLCALLLAQPLRVLAAEAAKTINSVTIRVSSGIEPGKSLPDIEVGSGTAKDGSVLVSTSDSKYGIDSMEWVDKSNKEVVAGDEPRMMVRLSPTDVSSYYFLASYKAGSIRVTGGAFVSAKRNGDKLEVTLRVKAVKGDYDPPEDAYWHEKNTGEARWDKPENTSGLYEVQLYCDGKSVFRVPSTSAVRYNFYPYMTKAGDYTFRVRTIPGTDTNKVYGTKSDWLESGELQITDRYVSDGKGQQATGSTVVGGTKEPVGWVKEADGWVYRHPDGELSRGKWENVGGLWYYFNMDGIMQTGWQAVGGSRYYLYPNGQMAVGWAKVDGKWYYFYTETDTAETAGNMAKGGFQVIGPYYYFFNEDGTLYTGWLSHNGKRYYLNTVENSLQGAMFTGWIKRDGKDYFADSNGEILEGWQQVDGDWHYFYPGTGEMAVNTEVDGFYVGGDGIWQ